MGQANRSAICCWLQRICAQLSALKITTLNGVICSCKLRESAFIAEAVPFHGRIANTRAGNPEPPLGFGKLTTTIAPDSGT